MQKQPFSVGGGSKKFEDWGGGGEGKNFRTGWGFTDLGGYFCWGVSTPLHAMIYLVLILSYIELP